jgi:hypothetical protein
VAGAADNTNSTLNHSTFIHVKYLRKGRSAIRRVQLHRSSPYIMRTVHSIIAFIIATSTLFLAHCSYNNEEALYGIPNGCDTAQVRYATRILPLLQNNCYPCHSTASNVAGLPFDSYESLRPLALNGRLVASINSETNPMPTTGLMPLCDRQVIESWVKSGAPNN